MKKLLPLLIAVSISASASSDSKNSGTILGQPSNAVQSATSSTAQPKGKPGTVIYKPETPQDITDQFVQSIPMFPARLSFDVSRMKLPASQAKLTVMNAYYKALQQSPALKYAYSVVAEYDSKRAVVTCSLKYMPYKSGAVDAKKVPAGTYRISNLNDLISAAQKAMGNKTTLIAIMNPVLDFDIMQKTLSSQVGYGFIGYSLNADATAIVARPSAGMTMEQCLDRIHQVDAMAEEVLRKIITNEMTPDQKTAAIYRYVIDTVTYDRRYYTDKKTMPLESETAYGAFHDHLAVCGGYSWAFKLLMNKAGIPCFNVSGIAGGEQHAWSVAKYNGDFYYFDSTRDQGRGDKPRFFAKRADDWSNRVWDRAAVDALLRD